MSDREVTGDELKAMRERVENARVELNALCNGKRWRMSVPVQDDDSDVVIAHVLRDALALIDRVSELEAQLQKLFAFNQADQAVMRQLADYRGFVHSCIKSGETPHFFEWFVAQQNNAG